MTPTENKFQLGDKVKQPIYGGNSVYKIIKITKYVTEQFETPRGVERFKRWLRVKYVLYEVHRPDNSPFDRPGIGVKFPRRVTAWEYELVPYDVYGEL